MSKQVYISADYATDSGDRDVVDVLQTCRAYLMSCINKAETTIIFTS